MRLKKFILPFFTIILSVIIIFITSFFLVFSDKNMNSKQNLPDFNGTTIDFTGYDIKDSYLKQHMKGNYEFYYNRWIIEEKYDGQYDNIVKVPHHLKNTLVNGKKISNIGYCSYKCYVKGLPIGTKIWFINNNFVGGFYAYINGKLVLKYGTRDKTGNCKSNGGDDLTLEYIVEDNNPLEVVFEVSSSFQGGLTSPARLIINTLGRNPTSQYLTNNIGFIVLGLVIGLLIFSLIINLKVTYRDIFFSLFMLCITLMTFFSIDVYWRFLSFTKLNTYNYIIFINLIVSIILSICLYISLLKAGQVKENKIIFLIFLINSSIDIVLYFILMGTFFQIISLMLTLINFVIIFVLLNNNIASNKINLLYDLMIVSLLTYFTATFFDLENIMIAGLEQSISYLLFPIIIIVIILYRIYSTNSTNKYIHLLEEEKKELKVKADLLKNQIKPHYIFNVLSSIEQAYKVDYFLGEEMLNDFSKHLRSNLETKGSSLVSINEEIDIILNYVRLENLRKKDDIEILLDIEETDFLVPPLSLETFIENAIKYSKIEEKKGGFISISTYKDDYNYYIEIEDNGIGFNIHEVKEESIGIKNAKERIRILTGGNVEIVSKIDIGTKIVITLPRKE